MTSKNSLSTKDGSTSISRGLQHSNKKIDKPAETTTNKPPILRLTLKREWFDKIARGEKKEEYREDKDYWTKRLVDENAFFKIFEEVHFRNGYSPNSPFMRVECGCIYNAYRTLEGRERMVYVIELGKVLEIKNQEDSHV